MTDPLSPTPQDAQQTADKLMYLSSLALPYVGSLLAEVLGPCGVIITATHLETGATTSTSNIDDPVKIAQLLAINAQALAGKTKADVNFLTPKGWQTGSPDDVTDAAPSE